MNNRAEWRGILPIVSVPFRADQTLDIQGFQSTLECIDSTDAFGMVLFGIASEFYKLTDQEKDMLAGYFADFSTRKKKIISVTDHATYLAVEKAKKYAALDIDGLMVLPPFFLHPGKTQVVHHVRAIVEAVSLPVIVQIAPQETGMHYSTEELIALHARYTNVIFKIEGSPVPEDIISGLRAHDDSIVIYNGYAGIYMCEMLELGCQGIMPGCSFVDVYTRVYRLYREKKYDEAQKLHSDISKYIKKWMTHCEYIIAVEKYVLQKRNVIAHDVCRMPTHVLTDNDKREIDEFYARYIAH